MTNHFQILAAWIDSCETDLQLDNIGLFVSERLITDDKQRDDIIDYLHAAIKRRSWCAAKVAQRDFIRVPDADTNRFSDDLFHGGESEYQPTDIIN